jgi:hypothetical protein
MQQCNRGWKPRGQLHVSIAQLVWCQCVRCGKQLKAKWFINEPVKAERLTDGVLYQ